MKDSCNNFGSLNFSAKFLLTFLEAAEAAGRKAQRKFKRPVPKRGLTLPLLKKRGSKAQLARLLGLPRQRLQDCLKAKTACLVAERALFLFCWIAARQQGRDLAP